MMGFIAKPLALVIGVAWSIGGAYLMTATFAYFLADGYHNPAAGHAAVGDITRTWIGFLTAVGPGLIDVFQAVGRAAMNALQ